MAERAQRHRAEEPQVLRYVQNHFIGAIDAEHAGAGMAYDGCVEVWFEDREAYEATMATPMLTLGRRARRPPVHDHGPVADLLEDVRREALAHRVQHPALDRGRGVEQGLERRWGDHERPYGSRRRGP